MTHVIGIDPSSKKIAICHTHNSNTYHYNIYLPEGVHPASGAAFREVFAFFKDFTGEGEFKDDGVVVYMEAPVVGRNAYSTIVQAQVGGAIMAAVELSGIQMFLVNVNSWKKDVIGKGNATKPEVAEWLKENWPDAYNSAGGDQDLLDASAINRYGYKRVRLTQAILLRRKKRGSRQGQKVSA
jgi:hypothetical protein